MSWRRDLKADLEALELLILMLKDITPEHDMKLQRLVTDLKTSLNIQSMIAIKSVDIYSFCRYSKLSL